MKRLIPTIVSLLALAPGGRADEMSYGKKEYLASCAVCHGADGKGNGPMAGQLLKRPADLTRLRERNHGEFPYLRVLATIDGRYIVPAHGEREMPIWGRQFLDQDTKTFGPSGGEISTTERIHQLTEYVQSLQR